MDISSSKTTIVDWDLDSKTGLWKAKNTKCNIFTDDPHKITRLSVDEDLYIDKTKIKVREISPSVARSMIIENHYSHSFSTCSVALGIFYKVEPTDDEFFESDVEKLIGCIVYGIPIGRDSARSISESLHRSEVYELTRIWIDDLPACKNIESYCIGRSFEWLRRNRPQIKALLSYTDSEVGHVGTIYQSTNWLYQGSSQLQLMPNYSISLTGPSDGYQWIHSRSVAGKFGSHNVESLKKVIGRTFWRREESSKHRYIYILLRGKERTKLLRDLKHPLYPYPKEGSYVEKIDEICVDEKEKSDDPFFLENT